MDTWPQAANASGSSTLCYICRSGVPSPKSRRTLAAVSDQNRKAVSFLDKFVTASPSEQSVRLYICKPCFAKSDKARRAVELAETTINALRAQVRGGSPPPVDLMVAVKDGDTSDTSQSSPREISPSLRYDEQSSVSQRRTPTRRSGRNFRVHTPTSRRAIFRSPTIKVSSHIGLFMYIHVLQHKSIPLFR